MGVAGSPTTKNEDKHMKSINKYVGLDVHKDTIMVAVAESGRDGEVRLYGQIDSDLTALERVLRKLGGEGSFCTWSTRPARPALWAAGDSSNWRSTAS